MKSYEIMALSQRAKTMDEGEYKIVDILPYTAYDRDTGEDVKAYLVRVADDVTFYKLPPIGCRSYTACKDDIDADIRNNGYVRMTIEKRRGSRGTYKLVCFG